MNYLTQVFVANNSENVDLNPPTKVCLVFVWLWQSVMNAEVTAVASAKAASGVQRKKSKSRVT